jgi:hypothetical protein
MTSRIFSIATSTIALSVLIAGCGQNGSVVEERSASGEVAAGGGDTVDRMGMGAGMESGELPPGHPPIDGSMGGGGGAMMTAGAQFTYELPEGWQDAPPAPMRDVNLRVGPEGAAEAFVTVLPGGAGGVEANVNRWRQQMNLEPYSSQEIAELQRIPLLEGEAILVDFTGAYSGMSDEVQTEEARLIGAILDDESRSVFIKLVGPTEALDGEKENFIAFSDSLEMTEGAPNGAAQDPHAGIDMNDPHAGINMNDPHAGLNLNQGGNATTPDAFTWLTPDGWTRSADRPMRVVTYTMGESGKSECYVTTLSGAAGGVTANINRWQNQMGQQPLSQSEIEALPDVEVLGKPCKLVQIGGDFTGMDGQTTQNASLLGIVCELPNQTLFVKMTGPANEVNANKEAFIAFCESLAREETSAAPVI